MKQPSLPLKNHFIEILNIIVDLIIGRKLKDHFLQAREKDLNVDLEDGNRIILI